MGDYRSLLVWQQAHKLALDVYITTQAFPRGELYGLTDQMRRAAVSIPANLAEGCGRDSDREIARFARIALGSASELEYYLLLTRHLGYLADPDHRQLMEAVRRIKPMLASLARALTINKPSRKLRRPTTDDR